MCRISYFIAHQHSLVHSRPTRRLPLNCLISYCWFRTGGPRGGAEGADRTRGRRIFVKSIRRAGETLRDRQCGADLVDRRKTPANASALDVMPTGGHYKAVCARACSQASRTPDLVALSNAMGRCAIPLQTLGGDASWLSNSMGRSRQALTPTSTNALTKYLTGSGHCLCKSHAREKCGLNRAPLAIYGKREFLGRSRLGGLA